MAGFSYSNNEHLKQSDLWSMELKDILYADLAGQRYCKMLDFPDGDTYHIPSVGQMELSDYEEGRPVQYTSMDTGEFTFANFDYKSAATYITAKMRQDSAYAAQLEAMFVPKMSRALAEDMEAKIMALGPDGQTATSLNNINSIPHRWVAAGTNETIDVLDFAKAKFALDKLHVPNQGRVAIVDPSVEFKLNTLPNITNISNNPTWGGIITTGFRTGMRFIRNIYGFDIYVSDFLKRGISETISTSGTVTAGVANLFFSAASDVLPFVGAIRQAPKVDSEWNKDYQREEYVVTSRYGYKLYRPENMVVVLSDTDQVFV